MEVLLLKFEDNLLTVQDKFYNYDLTDSVIEYISFEDNLKDFKLIVDYFFTEKEEEHLLLLFRNCTDLNYSMSKKTYELNDYELNVSQFTLTKVLVEELDKQICIKLFTIDDENEFLKIVCQDVSFISE